MNDVQTLINSLSWNQPEHIQITAINELTTRDDYNIALLIQPNGKECWGNAAEVLKNMGYPHVKALIPELLEWLQDMNWPGAWVIMEILETVDKQELLPNIEMAVLKADKEKDGLWLEGITELVHRLQLDKSNFSNIKIYEILESVG